MLFQKLIKLKVHRDVRKWMRLIFLLGIISLWLNNCAEKAGEPAGAYGVAVLLVDTDRVIGIVDEDIYGHFLEHINHSVVDGLFAEQIRGRGFEANDFEMYWKSFTKNGSVRIADVKFENGEKSIRLEVDNGTVGIRQDRIYVQEGYDYSGSVWLKHEQGSVQVSFRVKDSAGNLIAEVPLETSGSEW